MEAETDTSTSVSEDIQAVRKLLWGLSVKEDVFRRWSQGFFHSQDEPSALVQCEGGPCAIIAPVQAFILKAIITDPSMFHNSYWRKMPKEKADALLCQGLAEILYQAANSDKTSEKHRNASSSSSSSKLQKLQQSQNEVNPTNVSSSSSESARIDDMNSSSPYCIAFLHEPLSRRISCESESEAAVTPPPSIADRLINRPEEEIFHRNLRLLKLETISQVENVLKEKIEALKGYYGILQFLYSLILTKGLMKLDSEMADASELIDPVHGHGSQSLINLMLTGRGVSYVWDDEKDVGGLKLKGIDSPCQVGFLTVLERLRYCEVGSFLKSPKYPIWVLGSETHLTVLFSTNMDLVSPETPGETARRVFHSFDPEGNNFISAVLLEDVLRTLDLFCDAEYVELMKKKLDPESLGIILLNDFMDEFFPNEKFSGPDTFTLFHYNGLPRSCHNQIVSYQEGNAILLESDLRCMPEDNVILTCLQTKWPNIDVQWTAGFVPSIN